MLRLTTFASRFTATLSVIMLTLACLSPTPATAASETDQRSPVERILAAGPDDGYAYEWLGHLCDDIGPRLMGSPAYDRAAEWAVESLRQAGLDRVWTEPVMVPVWQRGVEKARMTAPLEVDLPISTLGRSIGTAKGGLEAEVMVVLDFDELETRAAEAKGKIVLFNQAWKGYGTSVRYRTRGASAAARHGAVAVLVRSVTGHSLSTLHTGVMTYAEDAPKIPAAAITVEDAGRIYRLTSRGRTVRVHLEIGAVNREPRQQANVLGDLLGSELPEEIVIVGGHLDSWDVGTGAHDDGCGCAIAVGAVRLIHALDLRPRRTIRVVLYAGEEFGGYGGDAYLEAHSDEVQQHVAAMESDSGCFLPDGFSVKASAEVIERLSKMAEPLSSLGADNVREGWAGVDIGPIVNLGVPGIGYRTKHERYFNYHHSPADTFDKIKPSDLAANVTAAAALLWAIADDPVSLRENETTAGKE